ncbi:MAG: spirocyclase AveC family protein [Mycolicibacterium cosmeticum]|nr:spirocyclase AveC family protein [Mycolicibacterium cosmeticum]
MSSGLSAKRDKRDKRNEPALTESLSNAASLGAQPKSKIQAVHIWATLGGAILAFQLYVWGRWITGPYFEQVPLGPTKLPPLMETLLFCNMVALIIGLPIGIYIIVIRPWRRERRITLDGMLLVSFNLMFFQDPLLNYFNTWCTYNTWSFNRGSWSSDVPGWMSPEEPGRQVLEPLLSNATGYGWGLVLITAVGCWVMRVIKRRFPNISNLRLILVTYALAIVFDFVMEGLVLLPTGVFIYPGAIQSVSINAGHYYQWPIYEGLMWGGVQAGFCCLRFFTDDRGRTIVERGLDQVRGSFAKQQLVRFLAIFAACSTLFFVIYNIPAQWFGMHADPWPADVQKRSYFTAGLCGDGTDRPCPDPRIPMPTKGSGYINTGGQLVLPDGVELPKVVPFERGN